MEAQHVKADILLGAASNFVRPKFLSLTSAFG